MMRLLSALMVTLVASSAAHEVNERAGADFVQRSLDKTIVVYEDGDTETMPGQSGTRVIYIDKRRSK